MAYSLSGLAARGARSARSGRTFEVERGRILGTLFSSTLFPGRAPEGHVALTTFIGGMRAPDLATRDDEALRALVAERAGEVGSLEEARRSRDLLVAEARAQVTDLWRTFVRIGLLRP